LLGPNPTGIRGRQHSGRKDAYRQDQEGSKCSVGPLCSVTDQYVTAVAKIGADTPQLRRNLGTTPSWELISAALAKAQKWTLKRVSKDDGEDGDVLLSPKRIGVLIYSHHGLGGFYDTRRWK
jgi:hypothetical protein